MTTTTYDVGQEVWVVEGRFTDQSVVYSTAQKIIQSVELLSSDVQSENEEFYWLYEDEEGLALLMRDVLEIFPTKEAAQKECDRLTQEQGE